MLGLVSYLVTFLTRFFHFLQNNNITDVNIDTFCRSNDTYYLRPSLNEVRMDGNPVILSKYPDSFTCMKVLPIGRYRWANQNSTVPLFDADGDVFPQKRSEDSLRFWISGHWSHWRFKGVNVLTSENLKTGCNFVRSNWNGSLDWRWTAEGFCLLWPYPVQRM